MKARLHPTPAMQKAIYAYAESKIQGIQSRAQEAVMKERNDIATRATYLCLLACYQVGLSPRTLSRPARASFLNNSLMHNLTKMGFSLLTRVKLTQIVKKTTNVRR